MGFAMREVAGSALDGEPLELVVESIRSRLARGESPVLEEYVARHPELADEIRDLWPALLVMEDVARGSLQDAGSDEISTGDGGPPGSTLPELGDYRLLREIGRGGMGVVYEAEQISLGRSVALKVLPRDLTAVERRLQRFEREARAAGRLHHTNIVPVFGLGHHEGTHFYVMQLIRGPSLDRVIEELANLRARERHSAHFPGADAATRVVRADRQRLDATQVAESIASGRFSQCHQQTTVTIPDDRGVASGDTGENSRLGWDLGANAAAISGFQRSELSSLSATGASYWTSVAQIGLQASEALQHAHEQSILHRDIKPSNLLLDVKGTVWITDFGLAKVLDDEISQSRDLAGTIRYMAPERFKGEGDQRSDVYSLGLTLYELLVLRPAYGGRDHHHVISLVTRESPPSPSRIDPTIPRDLVTIVQKAIEREPACRYQTARALADDLRCFLEQRPIRARATRLVERYRLWCRRNPALAISNSMAAVLLTVVAVVSTLSAARINESVGKLKAALTNQMRAARLAEAEAKRAEQAELIALKHQFESLVSEARARRYSGRQGQRLGTLEAVREANALIPRLGLEEVEISRRRDELRELAVAALALADLQQTTWPDYPGIRDDWDHYAVSPDGTLRVRGDCNEGTLVVTRAADDSEVARLPACGAQRGWMQFSRCNRYLAFARRNDWFIWTIGEPHEKLVRSPARAAEAVFSHDGAFLYMLCPEAGQLLRMNCQDGVVERAYTIPALPARNCNMALSPGGDRLALSTGAYLTPESRIVRVLDLASGGIAHELDCGASLLSLAWNASGTLLAAGPTNGSEVNLWDMTKDPPVPLSNLNQRRESNVAVAFNTSGTMLACVSNWGMGGLTVYEPNTRRQLLRVAGFTLHGFPTRMHGLSAGDRIVATVQGSGHTLAQSDIVPGSAFRSLTRTIPGHETYESVTIHKASRLAAGGTIRGAVLWDLATGQQVGELPAGGHVWFEPEGGALWTSDTLGKLRWPIEQAGRRFRIGPPTRFQWISNHDLPVRTSADGRVVALSPWHEVGAIVFPRDHPEQAIRIADGQDIRLLDVTSDGRFVITEQHVRGKRSLWNAANGELLLDLEQGYDQSPFWREWSRFHDLPPGTKPWQSILELRLGWFSQRLPDQRLILEREGPGRIRIEQIDTERVIARLHAPLEEHYRAVAVSPDGGYVLATGNDDPGSIRMWDLRLVRRELAAMGLDWDAPPISRWPDDEDLTAPLEVEVITAPIEGPSFESRWMLRVAEQRIADTPWNAEAHYERGIALSNLYRFDEARSAFDKFLEWQPGEPRALLARARVHAAIGLGREAVDDEAVALASLKSQPDLKRKLARDFNNLAWQLVSHSSANELDARWGVFLARQAVLLGCELANSRRFLNTLGAAHYRDRSYKEASEILRRITATHEDHNAYDLYFLAMAEWRLGNFAAARAALDQVVRWRARHQATSRFEHDELEALRAEAERLLDDGAGE